jgi:hypothetical protein
MHADFGGNVESGNGSGNGFWFHTAVMGDLPGREQGMEMKVISAGGQEGKGVGEFRVWE